MYYRKSSRKKPFREDSESTYLSVYVFCYFKIDTQSENLYVEKVNTSISSEKGKKIIRYEPKPVSTQKQGEYIFYKRDPGIAINALKNADYKCEYCSESNPRKNNHAYPGMYFD